MKTRLRTLFLEVGVRGAKLGANLRNFRSTTVVYGRMRCSILCILIEKPAIKDGGNSRCQNRVQPRGLHAHAAALIILRLWSELSKWLHELEKIEASREKACVGYTLLIDDTMSFPLDKKFDCC